MMDKQPRNEREEKSNRSSKQKPYGPRVVLKIPDFESLSKAPDAERPPKKPQLPTLPESTQRAAQRAVDVAVENPWITEMAGRKALDSSKNKPARLVDKSNPYKKIVPSKLNEASFRLDEFQQKEPKEEDPPGSNHEKTMLVLRKEYAIFEHPGLKATRDISRFDVWIESVPPEYWLEFYEGKPGPHAMSPVFCDGVYTWEPVDLIDYDPSSQKFLVMIRSNQMHKKVQRLAIRFNDEDPDEFQERVTQARKLQADFQQELRICDYIDSVPVELCSQLRKDIKTNILRRTVQPNKRFDGEEHLGTMKDLMAIVGEEYVRAMKKCIMLTRMQDPANHPEFHLKKIGLIDQCRPVPEIGTVLIPIHNYAATKKRIEELHWYQRGEIVQVNKVLSNKCCTFLEYRFLETKELEMPMELRVLYSTQKNHLDKMKQQILIHWREYFISETQDKMEKYNFFAVDGAEYKDGYLHRVLKRIDFVMNASMRTFARQSIADWVEFLRRFSPPQPGQSYECSQRPLVILQLNAEKQKRKKKAKQEEEEQANPIDFKPTLNQTYKYILQFIDWVVEATNEIPNLESDLVPFMNIPKAPVYYLKDTNKRLTAAKEEVNQMLDRYSEGVRALLQDYQELEWVALADPKSHASKLFEQRPSIEKLRRTLMDLSEAREKLVTKSSNTVNFELFQVQCDKFKQGMSKKVDELAQAILERISGFSEDQVEKLHTEYSDICARIRKVPTNEDELFDMKLFARNIKAKKSELHEQEMQVIQHILILEDYLFAVPENISLRLWQIKTLPVEVEIAISEGMSRLETEEEKFRDKLEKEKLRWFKETNDLRAQFEAVQQFADYTDYTKSHEAVKRLEENLRNAMKQLTSFNQRETLFELQLSDKSEMQKMIDEFEPFNKLWTNINDFNYGFDTWMTEKKIHELNAGEISGSVDRWLRECFMLNKKLQDKSPEAVNAINRLRDHLIEFQENIPLIKSISNEAWIEDHWGRLCVATEFPMENLDARHETVSTLIEKGFKAHIEVIEQISYRAQREFRLKIKLNEMKKQAEAQALEILHYKESFVIKTIEDIQAILDEQIINIQAMKTSPYAKPIEKQCKDWENRLLDIQETLEQWMKCQTVWMNLEPIFASDDIQKSMPMEFRQFRQVDTSWKLIMESTQKDPVLLDVVSADGSTQAMFKDCNKSLDEIQKSMHDYLERKRLAFPRFFFLSDEDLLDILSQTKDPLKVQPHLNKCFEAIDRVNFTANLEVTHMYSPEKETVQFLEKICVNEGDRKGNVEFWMGDIQAMMFKTVRKIMKDSFKEYHEKPRTEWVKNWQSMIVLAVDQIVWTDGVEQAIRNNSLRQYEEMLSKDILGVVALVRGKLESLTRKTLSAVITIDVHARDIVTDLRTKQISDNNQFDWIAQLRYYWEGKEDISVRMVNSSIKFGFEYLGNTPRLVITSLTDRCYRTLIGAYNLFYGGAPEGPAGTGKTESVKDLAKAVAVKCVVFNCSDTLDYVAMGKFFKGLASSGSWCCFDEFNRIEPEVLSVIAMQVLQIQQAIREKRRTFKFEGTDLALVHSCAINITMNPGYAGRSDLPDNLKALFRPCAMMVPDYGLISEISLYSYGFESARHIATKVVASLRLSSEQLSTQGHYDFGMRAVKAILTACGNLKIKFPTEKEDILALRALNDVNLPKFTSNDIPLFLGITSDLFPGVLLPEMDYGQLLVAIQNACLTTGLQPTKEFNNKCIQLFETICVRHGLMLVGQAFSGKTCVINTLQHAISSIPNNPEFAKVIKISINPKAITMTQLYGRFIPQSHQWYDGVISSTFRIFTAEKGVQKKWVIFDGPVDSKWIESMNTVLDDNKMLCLASGEIIKLGETMTMMFEVEDLKEASPATVSRCGMVFLEPHRLGWEVLVRSYADALPYFIRDKHAAEVTDFLIWFGWPLCEIIRKRCKMQVLVTDNELMKTTLNLLECFIGEYRDMLIADEAESPDKFEPKEISLPKDFEDALKNFMLFSVIWGFGGVVDEKTRVYFEEAMARLMGGEDVKSIYKLLDLPAGWEPRTIDIKLQGGIYDFVYLKKAGVFQWAGWAALQASSYVPDRSLQFHEILVPTKDTLRITYMLSFLAQRHMHAMFCGPTGTGKTVCVLQRLREEFYGEHWNFLFMAFSAQTSANQIQLIMEGYTEKRSRHVNAPAGNRKLVIFVDDLNMPAKEEYGAQPPIELLRQWMDHEGWYDLETKEFKRFVDLQFVTSMGPPGGGRNTITQRYIRHFNKIYVEPFGEESLQKIFTTIVEWFFHKQDDPFAKSVQGAKDALVGSTIHVFNRICAELLPTPAKIHYVYNLRDVAKVFQGISRARSLAIPDEKALIKLWAHECLRVFQDRLINTKDRDYFDGVLSETAQQFFKKSLQQVITVSPLLFGSFIPMISREQGKPPVPDLYCELSNRKLLSDKMSQFLQYYNQISPSKMTLVLFMSAVEHIVKIVRIIQQPLGNALLLGVGGSGRKSLTMLATSIVEYSLFEVEISKGFGMSDWREKIRSLFFKTGLENAATVFMFSDSQISNEGFLEDINNLLNNGEVPNLFAAEDKQNVLDTLQEEAVANKKGDSAESIFAFFSQRVRDNLHLVLCLSPIGQSFRRRLLMFPSLVNCCTIDWFLPWPKEALQTVAVQFLENVDVGAEVKKGLVEVCVDIQQRVTDLAVKYKEELRRYYYVTPTSYLELIYTFQNLLNTNRVAVKKLMQRYEGGLEKLLDTASKVAVMQAELEALQPQLYAAQAETKVMMQDLTVQQAEAQQVQTQCEIDQASCKEEREAAAEIKRDCEARLAEALPAYNAALKALSDLDKSQIEEVKSMKVPPAGVRITMEAVCKLMMIEPIMVPKKSGFGKEPDYWQTAVKNVLNRPKLKDELVGFDKDNINPEAINQIQQLINNPEFQSDKIKRASIAAFGLSIFVKAMYRYDKVAKQIRPKRIALREAEEKLKKAEAELAQKMENLRQVQELVAKLEAEYKIAVEKEQKLEEDVAMCKLKLERAQKLIDGLKDEKVRWSKEAELLKVVYVNVVGDLMISSGIIAYLGVFTGIYRSDCVENWMAQLKAKNIPSSAEFSLQKTLGNPVKIRDWTMAHLPNDSFSIDNAIILEYSSRWPLMIDPQVQANKWIKHLEGSRLDVTRLNSDMVSNTLVNAINYGKAVLIENMGEVINPELDNILSAKKGSEGVVKIGDKVAEMSRDFRLYMTTKLPSPHYAPEICVRVALLNFMTTEEGLLDQMLALTVNVEAPHIEANRQKCIADSARFKKELKSLEDRILELVSNAQGDILEDENLILTLQQSKTTSKEIQDQLNKQESIQKHIEETRTNYKPVAFRVSQLFFCVADLCTIEPMYQYSLGWYERIYKTAMQKAEKATGVHERVRHLNSTFTQLLYENVCRSLFEKDKLLFSLLVCMRIMDAEGRINLAEKRFLLAGGSRSHTINPNPTMDGDRLWLGNKDWAGIEELSEFPQFRGFADDFALNVEAWKTVWATADPLDVKWPNDWKAKLQLFQQIIVLRLIRPDTVVPAIERLIVKQLGKEFISPPAFNLEISFQDTEVDVPVVFILSPGVDPISDIEKLAIRKGCKHKMEALSLGDGQGPIAEAALNRAISDGGWVILQNCHLAKSWMATLERRVDEINPDATKSDFRLWLTSMPSEIFPVTILQNSVKITNEPPKGLQKNLLRSYSSYDPIAFEDNSKPTEFKRLLFGLSFFHASIQERRKFGALGWNIPYEFSMSDLSISFYQLRMFLNEYEVIPWDALRYMVAQANYGGRVTDYWDRRTIVTILEDFYTTDFLEDSYRINACSEYKMPNEGGISDYIDFINNEISHSQVTKVFGLHENANITSAINETNELLAMCLSLQPRATSGVAKTPEQIISEIADSIFARMPELFDIEACMARFPMMNGESMNIVLVQELIRFNRLLAVIRESTVKLKKAVAGLVTMSADLEKLGNSLFDNRIPALWMSVGYPSLKPLGLWVGDFIERLNFMQAWVDNRAPHTFWISGFFFTQSFLTGVMQNYARKYQIPIDTLCYDFEVLSEGVTKENVTSPPDDGCYVYGLYLDGARWDDTLKALAEQIPKVLFSAVPMIWLKPIKIAEQSKKHCYECPVYKTSLRRGTLSTTGHSTNFVLPIHLDMQRIHEASHWIKRGTAMLTQLDY